MRTILPFLFLAACVDSVEGSTLDIAGTWDDQFGTTHIITAESWEQAGTYGTSVFDILEYDNDERWAVAQNDASNAYSGGLFSRFEWTEVGADLYFCQVLFDGATQEDAEMAGPADASDPTGNTCGGFAWSELNP